MVKILEEKVQSENEAGLGGVTRHQRILLSDY